MLYSKFDVAERQLLQAIQMFFREEDPISIHTLAEASNQVLNDIGGKYGARSFLRDNDSIRPEKRKEWLQLIFKSRNFFKHADRDKNDIHEFKPMFNDFSLLDGINMYCTIKKKWVPEVLVFQVWFSATYPHLLTEDCEFNSMIMSGLNSTSLSLDVSKSTLSKVIEEYRKHQIKVDNVSLEFGL